MNSSLCFGLHFQRNTKPTTYPDEDDIWWTPDQARKLLRQMQEAKLNNRPKSPKKRRKRNIHNFEINPDLKWKLPILYKLDHHGK